MIALALYVTFGVLCVLVPVVATSKFLEWQEWDTDRRVERLRARARWTS